MKLILAILSFLMCSVAHADNPSPVQVIRLVYSSTNVTTSAWVQLAASLPLATRYISIFDSSGQTMKLGIGASGSEVAQNWYIFPGGMDLIPVSIAALSRLSIEAVSASATTGEIDLNLYY